MQIRSGLVCVYEPHFILICSFFFLITCTTPQTGTAVLGAGSRGWRPQVESFPLQTRLLGVDFQIFTHVQIWGKKIYAQNECLRNRVLKCGFVYNTTAHLRTVVVRLYQIPRANQITLSPFVTHGLPFDSVFKSTHFTLVLLVKASY